jgi:hypothetical protein
VPVSTRQIVDAAFVLSQQRDALLAACKTARDQIATHRQREAEATLNRAIASALGQPMRIEPPAELALVADEPEDNHWRKAG